MKAKKTQIVLAAPDSTTFAHVIGMLKAQGVVPRIALDGSRDWNARAREAIDSLTQPILFLVPSNRLPNKQLDLAQRVVATGGVTFVWSGRPHNGDARGDRLLMDKLLDQRGAIVSSSLTTLVEAVRITDFLGKLDPFDVRLKGRKSALKSRLHGALAHADLAPIGRRFPNDIVIEIGRDGKIEIESPNGRRLALGAPDVIATALSLLCRARSATVGGGGRQVGFDEIDSEVVDLIARPPGRLLSETTSKRLASAFGIHSGPERLCTSPTEASRFAADLKTPVVLKLVRPYLEGKSNLGAISPKVTGHARVRREYHSLQALGTSLSPPTALGILVAAHVDGGSRIWLKMADHPVFGRLVIGGCGDIRDESPQMVLSLPIFEDDARKALCSMGFDTADEKTEKLARATALFGNMIGHLGDKISRAEIHPLVARKSEETMALDVLIEIDGGLVL